MLSILILKPTARNSQLATRNPCPSYPMTIERWTGNLEPFNNFSSLLLIMDIDENWGCETCVYNLRV